MKSIPKPALVMALFAIVAAGLWLWNRSPTEERWLGYVEGEPLYLAAPVSGRLQSRAVERGSSVAPGSALFSLDPETVDASVSQAQAQVASTMAQAQDLGQAKQRQAEIDVYRAAQAAAEAALVRSQNDFDRISALNQRGFASRSQLDAARAARDGARAGLSQAQAQIRSAELTAGRSGQIAAAQAGVAGAEAALRAQRKTRSDIAPTSPTRGVIEQTYYNPGEWVPANSPVVAIIPDDRRKIRFYVPQDRLAGIRTGATIRFSCDGCGGDREARISYVAPRSEYTPPVIYSERARAKLVFMVEALLPADKPLPLGLPVAVVPQ